MNNYWKSLIGLLFFGVTGGLMNAALKENVYHGAIIGLLFFIIMKDELIK